MSKDNSVIEIMISELKGIKRSETHELQSVYQDNFDKWIEYIDEKFKKKYFIDQDNWINLPDPSIVLNNNYREPIPFDKSLDEFIKIVELFQQMDEEFLNIINSDYNNNIETIQYRNIQQQLELVMNVFEDDYRRIPVFIHSVLSKVFSEKIRNKSDGIHQLYSIFYEIFTLYLSSYFDPIISTVSYYFINKRIRGDEFNNKPKKIIKTLARKNLNNKLRDSMNIGEEMIFLSYSFKDRFYSLGLYIVANRMGKYLFVDWMMTDEADDVYELKRNLSYALDNADKILFLRTMNSELNTEARFLKNREAKEKNKQIRQWCAWEMGYYYKNNCQKSKYQISKLWNSKHHFFDSILFEDNKLFLDDFEKIQNINGI
ncbi:MAG: hypothetical protein LBN08_02545 [Lactobacillales bacterium]|jgi:hypothetical protein|nr:hypothetical protein [Lactobacillales bacterium]